MIKGERIAWVGFLIVILGVRAHDFARMKPNKKMTAPRDLESVLSGRFTETFADNELVRSPALKAILPHLSPRLFDLFGETPTNVLATASGRMYWKAQSSPFDESLPVAGRNGLREVAVASAAFARMHGVKLVTLVMPMKWRYSREDLLGLPIPPERERLYDRALEFLRSLGTDAPDLRPILDDLVRTHPDCVLFAPAETHATRAVQRRVVEAAAAPAVGVSERTARERLDSLPIVESNREPGEIVFQFGVDRDHPFARRYSFSERTIDPPALRPEERADILVVGDSNSTYYDHFFARALASATGMSVDARGAGDRPAEEIAQLLAVYARTPPKFIFSVICERRFLPVNAGDI